MTRFAAESIAEPLEFSLRPWADVSGVIPEPSSAQVREYLDAVRAETERVREEIAGGTALAGMTPAQVAVAQRRNTEACSALCSGIPSAEQLGQLPHRPFTAFANWVAEEILDPEDVTGAGNARGNSPAYAVAG